MLNKQLYFWIAVICLIFGTSATKDAAMAADPRPANRGGVKIEVPGPGMVRLTGSDIAGTGVAINTINPDTLKVFHRDAEIPIIVASADPVFDGADVIEFYAPGIDNQFTGTDVFWLYWHGNNGKRMAWDSAAPDSGIAVSTFTETRALEENHLLWTQTPGAPAADYWFWEKLTAPQATTISFDLPGLVPNPEPAEISVYFQGVSSTSHQARIAVNSQPLADAVWTDAARETLITPIAAGLLKTRGNELKISSSAATGDVIYVNRIAVAYPRRLAAAGDQLLFTLSQAESTPVSVTGFTRNALQVADITNPEAVRRISHAEITEDQNGYAVKFQHPGGEKKYLALASNAAAAPGRLVFKPAFTLNTSANGADYLVITGKALMPGLEKLCELRRRQGFRVKMVDIEDIYDAFSYGFFEPSAVREFLKTAHDHWTPPAPRYVLLAGDSNLDYRNHFGTAKQNIVPVMLSATAELGLTPSDNEFAAFGNAGPVPQMHIGRISGSGQDGISRTARKIILYETDKKYTPRQVMFVADDDDLAFENLSDNLATYLPSGFTAVKIYARLYDALRDVTGNILSFIDSGTLITSFVGHGDVIRWGAEPYGGGEFILQPHDVDDLAAPGPLTFILALNCLNGYFSQAFDYSLAEEWMMAEDSGAIACLAPSGLSHQWEHDLLGQFVFEKIFLERENRIGDIATGSKIDAYYAGASDKVLISLNLIGDPATTLAINRNPAEMVTAWKITASEATGGSITPSGRIPAFDGTHETFAIVPDAGYQISDVVVDGKSQGAVGTYTFSSVSADHRISAEFKSEGSSDGGGGGGGCFIGGLEW